VRHCQYDDYFTSAFDHNDRQEQIMIEYDLDTAHSTVLVHLRSALDKSDFSELASAVDPQIEATGDLAGLIIDAPEFPGWDSFGTMVTHFRFVRDHHKRVKKVAIVTNSHIGDVAEHLASHFVSAEIRHFPGGQLEQARQWISGGADAGHATESRLGAGPQGSQI
jgi:SpoIIAA-like